MSEGNSATSWVQLFSWNAKFLGTVGGLTGEGFINFEDVDVVNCKSGMFECLGDSECWSNSHNFRWDSGSLETNHTSDDLASKFGCNISSCKKNA